MAPCSYLVTRAAITPMGHDDRPLAVDVKLNGHTNRQGLLLPEGALPQFVANGPSPAAAHAAI
jgi:hypothetical protein